MRQKTFLLSFSSLLMGLLLVFANSCKENDDDDFVIPVLSTSEVTDITETTAKCGGSITSDGGAEITARGVCWSTGQSPTISDNKTTDGTGVGVFSSSLSGLSPETTYYVRAYATNSAGTSYGNQVNFTTLEVIGDVYNPITGKTWMDRNLGASQVATSSTDAAAYGDLYQWGRAADGHQLSVKFHHVVYGITPPSFAKGACDQSKGRGSFPIK